MATQSVSGVHRRTTHVPDWQAHALPMPTLRCLTRVDREAQRGAALMRIPAGHLELADIDLLLSVQRLGSLGKAARAHQLSQPAVSARIQAVERRLGLRLLERSPSGSRLTPAGTTVATWGQPVV